jgi:hypothetical protein
MKARRKGTNEPFQKVASVCLCSGGYILIKDVEFEQEPHQLNPEEEKLRHLETIRQQAAIASMQGVMNFFGSIDYNRETIAELAVKQADALVKKLKGE